MGRCQLAVEKRSTSSTTASTRGSGTVEETFVGLQETPATFGERSQTNSADSDSHQSQHTQIDQFAHAADLAMFPFQQGDAETIGSESAHSCGEQRLPLQFQTVAEQAELFFSDLPRDFDVIFFFDARAVP